MPIPTSRLLSPTGAVSPAVAPSFEFGGQNMGEMQLPKAQPIPFPVLPSSPPAASFVGAPNLTNQEAEAIRQRIMGMGPSPTGMFPMFPFNFGGQQR